MINRLSRNANSFRNNTNPTENDSSLSSITSTNVTNIVTMPSLITEMLQPLPRTKSDRFMVLAAGSAIDINYCNPSSMNNIDSFISTTVKGIFLGYTLTLINNKISLGDSRAGRFFQLLSCIAAFDLAKITVKFLEIIIISSLKINTDDYSDKFELKTSILFFAIAYCVRLQNRAPSAH